MSNTDEFTHLSEQTRSLARTLQSAHAGESQRTASLRLHLMSVSKSIAESCESLNIVSDSGLLPIYNRLIEQIRNMAVELSIAPPTMPPGIAILAEALAARFQPDTLILLRPGSSLEYSAKEHLRVFHRLFKGVSLNKQTAANSIPDRLLILNYPKGEEDNILDACNFLPNFQQAEDSLHSGNLTSYSQSDADAAGLWTMGPAYLFATCLTSDGGAERQTSNRLLANLELLQDAAWFDQPHIGETLVNMKQQCSAGALPGLDSATSYQTAWQQAKSSLTGYSPDDFSRDVPILWERLRQLIPPNDLDMNGIESAKPADLMSILNAGWSFYLLNMNDLYRLLDCRSPEDRYEAKLVLNRLLVKGIELSRIAQRWQIARNE